MREQIFSRLFFCDSLRDASISVVDLLVKRGTKYSDDIQDEKMNCDGWGNDDLWSRRRLSCFPLMFKASHQWRLLRVGIFIWALDLFLLYFSLFERESSVFQSFVQRGYERGLISVEISQCQWPTTQTGLVCGEFGTK